MSLVSDKHFSYDVPNTYAMGTFTMPTNRTEEGHREEEDSPYEEVRASVSNTDDPDMPVNTARMWVIGLLLTVLGAGMNTFFIFRNPYRLVVSNAILYVYFITAADLRLYPANWSSASSHFPWESWQRLYYLYGHGLFQGSWEGRRYP
jgi:hypothetical protein